MTPLGQLLPIAILSPDGLLLAYSVEKLQISKTLIFCQIPII
jgi:hypothetical protein